MALSGVHFEWRQQLKGSANGAPVLGLLQSAETLATEGTTTTQAPASDNASSPLCNVIASADCWVTFGATPADPSSTTAARSFVAASTPTPFFVNAKDKARWVAA
ncbi:hypothetical protein G3A56_02255 [Rhizobium oryzihabitans]|uniref:Uncharacterized protein n=1 Tax=Rhizobium oryzihabitans TaxID=2267833 RepID=A0A7L5BCN8_9HYPH|nr:hypothetical protein [Rhizobium oryzihabitans]QIB36592.1 hypothetical protein G3A56_00055 [Rhizobium oryzihabitans]QIB36958.1 hypothetical protein G3A56_02255 [Rhizobium oryzihabitans]